jgi:cell division septal protein FtsQ
LAIVRTRKQKKKAVKVLLMRLLTSAMLGLLIFGVFHIYNFMTTSEKLSVTIVDFEGLSRVDPAEIDILVADIRGENILLVPLDKYEARFDGHPRIRTVRFKKILPNRVVCTVEERESVALVYTNGFHEVDREGMILPSDELTAYLDLPIISGLDRKLVKEGEFCDDVRLASSLEVLSYCKRYGGSFANDISELKIADNGINVVSLKEGMVLLLGESEFENRLKKFFLIRNTIAKRTESAKLIDLRFDDQVVLRSGI